MTTRIIGLSLLAASLSAGAWYMDLNSKKQELQGKRDALAALLSEIDLQNFRLTEAQRNVATLEQERTEATALAAAQTAARQGLLDEVPALESERDTLKQEFVNEVLKVRAKFSTMVIPELLLPDGMTLHNVTVKDVTESAATLVHSGGTQTIESGALPVDLRERLRLDASPMAGASELLASSAATNQTAAGTCAPELSESLLAKVSESEATLRKDQAKQTELQRTRQAYLAQVQDYREKDSRAKFLGQPMRYQAVIPKIIPAINELDTQLAELATKIVTLQMQVDDIKEGTVKDPVAAPDSPR